MFKAPSKSGPSCPHRHSTAGPLVSRHLRGSIPSFTTFSSSFSIPWGVTGSGSNLFKRSKDDTAPTCPRSVSMHLAGVCVWRINDNTACQLGNGGVSSGLCRAHKHTPTHICILVEFGINTASCCSDVQAFHVSCRPVTLVVRLVCLGCPVSVFGPSAPHSCILIVSGIQLIEASKHGSIANISTNVKLTKSLDRENTRTLENQ